MMLVGFEQTFKWMCPYLTQYHRGNHQSGGCVVRVAHYTLVSFTSWDLDVVFG